MTQANRIDTTLRQLAESGRTALVLYIAAGDPAPEATVPLMHALVQAGADIIELGVPFSDPMADGPVVQRAAERALAQGMTLPRLLELVAEFRRDDSRTPIVLMGYANPIERMGQDAFSHRAHAAGVDGVLVVDCPPEEAGEFTEQLDLAVVHPAVDDLRGEGAHLLLETQGEGPREVRVEQLAQPGVERWIGIQRSQADRRGGRGSAD